MDCGLLASGPAALHLDMSPTPQRPSYPADLERSCLEVRTGCCSVQLCHRQACRQEPLCATQRKPGGQGSVFKSFIGGWGVTCSAQGPRQLRAALTLSEVQGESPESRETGGLGLDSVETRWTGPRSCAACSVQLPRGGTRRGFLPTAPGHDLISCPGLTGTC